MSLGDRLKLLRGKESQKAFALKLDVDQTTIANYETGKRQPNAVFIAQICNLFNISADWLIYGEDKPALPTPATNNDSLTVAEEDRDGSPKKVQIPLVDTELAAGAGSFVDSDNILKYIEINEDIIKFKGSVKSLVFMSVLGDSMVPTLAHKDLVLISLDQTEPYSGGVFALAHDYGLLIKRLILEPGKLVLRSDNSYYKDTILDLRDEATMALVKIIGRAVWWCHDDRA